MWCTTDYQIPKTECIRQKGKCSCKHTNGSTSHCLNVLFAKTMTFRNPIGKIPSVTPVLGKWEYMEF